MDKDFNFYLKYLGASEQAITSGKRVFSSSFRGKPESELTVNVHDLLVSVFNETLIHSINRDLMEEYRKYAPRQLSDDLIEQVDDAFFQVCGYRYYWISEWFRYSTNLSFDASSDITVLTESHRDMIETGKKARRGRLFRDHVWVNTYSPQLLEGRITAVIKDGNIVSYSSVTDLPFNASNIAVWTHDEYRKRGYGSLCVKQAVNWCARNNRIPIYLASSSNTASIGLAEKLGFDMFAREIRTTVNVQL
ncbi:MAG: GNAT family N-acetyltransferase [Candidatus Aegiribacteria sp.]|nr:GNAT family N-acetyltransferase [Candidatus Aegiribacteria sp.]